MPPDTAKPIYQVDAFTSAPFAGNPAAVVLLDALAGDEEAAQRETAWMQAVAGEMNLSETAFVRPSASGKGRFLLRWFTPNAEVELCGHATLATAHVLWQQRWVEPHETIHFDTCFAGPLACAPTEDGRIAMALPSDPPQPGEPPAGLIDALGLPAPPVDTARGRYDWLIALNDAQAVRDATPDFAALAKYEGRGVTITAPADDDTGQTHGGDDALDFVSRFFAPRLRVAEDPVTGSVHALLGPYWGEHLGRTTLEAAQCSPRGGRLGVALDDTRVTLIGHAVTVLSGQLWH
jgi:PhzF family phenazine biosynthesis protein